MYVTLLVKFDQTCRAKLVLIRDSCNRFSITSQMHSMKERSSDLGSVRQGRRPFNSNSFSMQSSNILLKSNSQLVQGEREQKWSQNIADIPLCWECVTNDFQSGLDIKGNSTRDHSTLLWACEAYDRKGRIPTLPWTSLDMCLVVVRTRLETVLFTKDYTLYFLNQRSSKLNKLSTTVISIGEVQSLGKRGVTVGESVDSTL